MSVELPVDFHAAVRIEYTSGCRTRSELLTLERGNLDLEAGTLRLDAGATKSDEGRVVNLPPDPR